MELNGTTVSHNIYSGNKMHLMSFCYRFFFYSRSKKICLMNIIGEKIETIEPKYMIAFSTHYLLQKLSIQWLKLFSLNILSTEPIYLRQTTSVQHLNNFFYVRKLVLKLQYVFLSSVK